MGAGVPQYKGMGFWPVIAALKAHARGPSELPAALQHYFDDQVVVTGWYPEIDFIALLECLARVLQQDGMPDVWTYFGRVAARRDLAGTQELIPVERRVQVAGIYRRLASDEEIGVASWLVRVTKLWHLYHDTGHMVAGRSKALACGAVFRLYGYPLMTSNLAKMHTSYYDEYARIVELRAKVSFAGTREVANRFSEWELTCESEPAILSSLSTLPFLADVAAP
jgi:hypothetical protein